MKLCTVPLKSFAAPSLRCCTLLMKAGAFMDDGSLWTKVLIGIFQYYVQVLFILIQECFCFFRMNQPSDLHFSDNFLKGKFKVLNVLPEDFN